jgi:outer membrane protein assembly factor BamB
MSPNVFHLSAGWIAVFVSAVISVGAIDEIAAQDRQKEILDHLVYQSRATQSLLNRAQRHIKRKEFLAAFDVLQKILDGPSDSFLWPSANGQNNGSVLSSIRTVVQQLFEKMPADALKLYQDTHDGQATQLLKQAADSKDRLLADEVARRFYPTKAAFLALNLKATRVLDRGKVREANLIWRELIASSIHGKRCGKSIVMKAVVTSAMLGNQKEAQRLLDIAASRMGLPAAAITQIEEVTRSIRPHSQNTIVADWLLPFGNATHTAMAAGSAPYLNPAWRVSLSGDTPFSQIAQWESDVGANELDSMAVANLPLVVNGQIVFRDFTGIRGCDPATGKELWRYNSAISLASLWDEFENRAVAQTRDSLVQVAYSGNSLLGMLASDRERVFAIEWTSFTSKQNLGGFRSADTVTATNRLVAFRIPQPRPGASESVRVRRDWIAGSTSGIYETGIPGGDVLKGHLFVGPPLPVDGSVFVITELDRVLNLVKINATNGVVAWIQRIGLVEQPMFSGTERRRQIGCYLPTHANGLVICPTQSGVLIAVDAVSGITRWAYYYGESRLSRGSFSTRNLSDAQRSPGFVDPPHVAGNRVFYLPRLSQRLHCAELETGKQLWARTSEAQFIAVANEEELLLVGNSSVESINAESGEVNWARRIAIPAGRGVYLGTDYILPLKSGTISTISLKNKTVKTTNFVPALLQQRFERHKNHELESKNQRAADLRVFGLNETHIPSELRLGNLVAHGDKVFSLGPQYVIAYPQVNSLAAKSQRETERDLNTVARELANRLLADDNKDVAPEIEKYLSHGDANEHAKARWLLRELMLSRLSPIENKLTQSQQRTVIQSLDQLAEESSEHARAQMERARVELEFGATKDGLNKLFEFAELKFNGFVNSTTKHEGVVTADVWRREVLASILKNSPPQDVADLMQARLTKDRQVATNADTIEALRHFVDMYQYSTEAGRVRNRLADRLIAKNNIQEAELLLLENESHPDINVKAVAESLLIALFNRLGLLEEAGIRLHSFASRFATADLSAIFADQLKSCGLSNIEAAKQTGFTGQDFLKQHDRDLPSWHIHEDLAPLDWAVERVNVVKHGIAHSDPSLGDSWADGRNMTNESNSELAVIRRGTFTNSEWAIIDRFHGVQRGSVKMPGRFSLPVFPAYRQVGHFLPTGTMAGINGISLLQLEEQAPAWSHAFLPVSGIKNPMVEPGPAFPSICIFQTRKHLMGVHPGTGRVLWRRSDLDLASGVYVDKEAGLFGDEQVLVMFHSDLQSYDLLKTQTGETLRTGRLDLEFRYHRRIFGRKLMHVTRLSNGAPQRLRIWDPLTDKFDLDEGFVGRFYVDDTTNNEVAIIESKGRLRVFQVPQVKKIIDLDLGKPFMSTVVSLRTFSDGDTFYVNTQKNTGGAQQKYYFPATNSAIPFELVQQGNLMAIDIATGDVKWTHSTRQKVVLRLDRVALPFMVAVSRVRPRNSSKTQTLELQVIDRASGNLIGGHKTLIPDRLVHYRVDRPNGVVSLYGLQSRIDLDFSRRLQALVQDTP